MLSGKCRELETQEIHSRTKQGAIWKKPGWESENKDGVFSPSHEFMHPALFIIPVGGYIWVYSSKIDGMVAILCIFIQWNLRHLLHVLAGMFTQRRERKYSFTIFTIPNTTAHSRHNYALTLALWSCFCVSLKLRGVLRSALPTSDVTSDAAAQLDRLYSNRHCHRGGRGFHALTWGSQRAQETPSLRV